MNNIENHLCDHQNYDDFYEKLSKNERAKLFKLKRDFKKYYIPQAKESLIEELSTDDEHQNLLRFCARAFAKTALSEKSGYQFYFTEPLIEFCSPHSGYRNFDILLFDEFQRSAIFIECKTSSGKPGKEIKSLKSQVALVESHLEYLSEIIGMKLKKEKIEYVLCIFDKDRQKFKASFKDKTNNQEMAKLFKLWIYSPHSEIIQLYLEHSHNNLELSTMLLKGFAEKQSKVRFELPYIASSHKFSIIQRAIIGDCYKKNLRNQNQSEIQSSSDPKIIKIDDILSTLMDKISLGMSNEKKGELLREKLNYIILYGEKYDLLERLNDKEIRLISSGMETGAVLKHIKRKFIKRWIDEKTEELARQEALRKFIDNTGIKQLSDYEHEIPKK